MLGTEEVIVPEDVDSRLESQPPKPSEVDSRFSPGTWVTFNDFTVTESNAEEARKLYAGQKVPCLLLYTKGRYFTVTFR